MLSLPNSHVILEYAVIPCAKIKDKGKRLNYTGRITYTFSIGYLTYTIPLTRSAHGNKSVDYFIACIRISVGMKNSGLA